MWKVFSTAAPMMCLLAVVGCGGATPAPAAPSPAASTVAAQPSGASPAALSKPASAVAATQASPAAGKDAVRAAYLSLSSVASIAFIAKGAGLFDKYGLDVSLNFLLPAPLTQALVAGKDIDVGYSSAANIPTVNAQGADIVMLAASAQGGIFSLIAGPGIKTIADLKGKQVAVRGIGSTTDLLTRQVLQQNNLVPAKDVGITALGDDLAVLAALKTGQVAAVMNSEPFASLAVSQGGTVIYDQAKQAERAIQTPIAVKRGYLATHREILKRFLMANMESVHLIKTKPAEVVKYTVPYIKLDDTAALQRGLETSGKIMDDDMNIPMENLAISIKMAAATVPEVGNLRPEDMVDLSLIQEIKASGFLDKLTKS